MDDITRILSAIEKGDAATDELLPLIYDELRRLAAQKLAQENAGQTLQATALVHEVWLRLAGRRDVRRWDSRGHFFAAAAEAMRRILIDIARKKKSLKRGRGARRLDLEQTLTVGGDGGADSDQLLALDEALTALEGQDRRKAQLVKLRYFAGMTIDDAAQALGVSPKTAKRDWVYARAWLYGKLHEA